MKSNGKLDDNLYCVIVILFGFGFRMEFVKLFPFIQFFGCVIYDMYLTIYPITYGLMLSLYTQRNRPSPSLCQDVVFLLAHFIIRPSKPTSKPIETMINLFVCLFVVCIAAMGRTAASTSFRVVVWRVIWLKHVLKCISQWKLCVCGEGGNGWNNHIKHRDTEQISMWTELYRYA